MATAIWRSTTDLRTALLEQPERFDFFQAVRLLQHVRPNLPTVADSAGHAREAVHFRAEIGFAFAPSDIKAISETAGHEPAEMTVRHLSLAGAFGPLPAIYSERLIQTARSGDRQSLEFLDIFHNRLIALFFRAKTVSRPALKQLPPARTPVAESLFALIGMGTRANRNRLDIDDQSLLGFSGLLADRRRSAHALGRIIARHFSVKARVRQHLGRWWQLAENQTTRLGRKGRNNRLGQTTVLGDKVWNQSAAVGLDIGPVDSTTMHDLLPGGAMHDAFAALALFVTDRRYAMAVRLFLEPGAGGPMRLGSSRLNYESWLGKPAPRHNHAFAHLAFEINPDQHSMPPPGPAMTSEPGMAA
jgi:type VI secretion system protein ImpH